jgi:hypothetical protein
LYIGEAMEPSIYTLLPGRTPLQSLDTKFYKLLDLDPKERCIEAPTSLDDVELDDTLTTDNCVRKLIENWTFVKL